MMSNFSSIENVTRDTGIKISEMMVLIICGGHLPLGK